MGGGSPGGGAAVRPPQGAVGRPGGPAGMPPDAGPRQKFRNYTMRVTAFLLLRMWV